MKILLLVTGVVLVVVYTVMKSVIRPWLYDVVIVKMTTAWYTQVLTRLEPKTRVLDVGIGTGTSLLNPPNLDLIRSKELVVHGVDYDREYVKAAQIAFSAVHLDPHHVVHASIYDYAPDNVVFDAIYFSGSLMIMPDPVAALAHCATLLAPGGKIYLTQTFETSRNKSLEILKPLLCHLTTIDFGRVTYLDEFLTCLDKAHLNIVENTVFGDTKSKNRDYRVLVAEQRK